MLTRDVRCSWLVGGHAGRRQGRHSDSNYRIAVSTTPVRAFTPRRGSHNMQLSGSRLSYLSQIWDEHTPTVVRTSVRVCHCHALIGLVLQNHYIVSISKHTSCSIAMLLFTSHMSKWLLDSHHIPLHQVLFLLLWEWSIQEFVFLNFVNQQLC